VWRARCLPGLVRVSFAAWVQASVPAAGERGFLVSPPPFSRPSPVGHTPILTNPLWRPCFPTAPAVCGVSLLLQQTRRAPLRARAPLRMRMRPDAAAQPSPLPYFCMTVVMKARSKAAEERSEKRSSKRLGRVRRRHPALQPGAPAAALDHGARAPRVTVHMSSACQRATQATNVVFRCLSPVCTGRSSPGLSVALARRGDRQAQ
jgi:hypothetical protein